MSTRYSTLGPVSGSVKPLQRGNMTALFCGEEIIKWEDLVHNSEEWNFAYESLYTCKPNKIKFHYKQEMKQSYMLANLAHVERQMLRTKTINTFEIQKGICFNGSSKN